MASRADVERLVNSFYDRVRSNAVIGPIFNDIARIDWEHHLPKMYSFWSSILLGEQSYSGNPMVRHIELSRMTAMTETEFSEWLRLFNETIDALFEGPKAEEAKTRAANIARLMLFKIQTI
ncbi:globin family protein [Niabella soli DSM 19437]|uniref:Globin family protein n=1 Tax=Niabella soli DSM 19437 TaxID=929713 RepID=W0EUP2_9BACT|nr:globin family protein [Niabella soli DSM 19437]